MTDETSPADSGGDQPKLGASGADHAANDPSGASGGTSSPPTYVGATPFSSENWYNELVDLLLEDLAVFTAMREYIFYQGPPEQWPVRTVRLLDQALADARQRRAVLFTGPFFSQANQEEWSAKGLSGAQLELKLEKVYHQRNLVKLAMEEGRSTIDPLLARTDPLLAKSYEGMTDEQRAIWEAESLPRKVPVVIRRFARYAQTYLRDVDTILGSLGIEHWLTELKEVFESLFGATAAIVEQTAEQAGERRQS